MSSLLAASFTAVAQEGVLKTDSLEMGASYLNEVYYLLKDGSKKVEPTNNWHLAFRTGGQTDGIRINSATVSGAANGEVSIYVYPNGAAADWNQTIDTNGYASWLRLHNSDETWEVGALNTTAGSFPDFGWGVYNMSSHIVTGDSIYLVKFRSNGVDYFKKLFIERKQSSNWYFKFADIDGQNEVNDSLRSSDFSGANYMYYNLESASSLNREPANWDFTLTRYAALQINGTYFPSTGILTNIGVLTAKTVGKEVEDLTLEDTTSEGFSSNINVIGYDWKDYEIGQNGVVWYTDDSLAFFIQDRDKVLWKVVFTAFGGMADGKTIFNKTQLSPSVSVRDITSGILQTTVYPNPTQGKAQVLISTEKPSDALVSLIDINGRVIQSNQLQMNEGLNQHEINLDGLNNGVYFIKIIGNGFQSTERIVKF